MFTYLSSMVITASLIATINGQEVVSPPGCNVTLFGSPVFVIPVGLDWGYAGLEPNGETFCLGKGNVDATSFEFWLNLNVGTGCSMNGNNCLDFGLRATLLAGMQTAPASMNSNALAGHLHRLVNRGDKWLIVVVDVPNNLSALICRNNNDYCLIEPADYPQLPIKFVAAVRLADTSVQAGITTTIATLPPGVIGTAPTEPTTTKGLSALRISLLLFVFTYLTIKKFRKNSIIYCQIVIINEKISLSKKGCHETFGQVDEFFNLIHRRKAAKNATTENSTIINNQN